MSDLVDNIINKLSSATEEELQDNWNLLEPYEHVGMLASEFVNRKLQK